MTHWAVALRREVMHAHALLERTFRLLTMPTDHPLWEPRRRRLVHEIERFLSRR